MRLRALLIVATTLLGVLVLGGAALAATKTCSANPCVGTNGPDRLNGTDAKNEIRGLRGPAYIAGKQRADELYGGRGQDEVRAGNGRDRVFGGRGRDELYGGGGNDTMNAQDGYKDNVNCGLGTDTAYVDRLDRVNEDCENVFVAGGGPEPNPVVDKVSGKGELGSAFGNPQLRVTPSLQGLTPTTHRVRSPSRIAAIRTSRATTPMSGDPSFAWPLAARRLGWSVRSGQRADRGPTTALSRRANMCA